MIASPDHPHDLDRVSLPQDHGPIRRSLEDLAVVLDRDGAMVDAKRGQVDEERCGRLELDRLAVDAKGDHLKSLIAA